MNMLYMSSVELLAELTSAFADVPWPHASSPEFIEANEALEIADELFRVSDATKKYELPRLMSLAITLPVNELRLRDRLLCRLIEFLDVDFDDPDGTNDLLKEAKRRVFSDYSRAQTNAIFRWLRFLRRNFELTECRDLLSSALKYWGRRAEVYRNEKQASSY